MCATMVIKERTFPLVRAACFLSKFRLAIEAFTYDPFMLLLVEVRFVLRYEGVKWLHWMNVDFSFF